MNPAPVLAATAALALLGGCSPAPQQAAGKDEPRPAAAAMAEPVEDELPPVLDAEGHELDPELADAVREKMEENQAALEPAEDDAS